MDMDLTTEEGVKKLLALPVEEAAKICEQWCESATTNNRTLRKFVELILKLGELGDETNVGDEGFTSWALCAMVREENKPSTNDLIFVLRILNRVVRDEWDIKAEAETLLLDGRKLRMGQWIVLAEAGNVKAWEHILDHEKKVIRRLTSARRLKEAVELCDKEGYDFLFSGEYFELDKELEMILSLRRKRLVETKPKYTRRCRCKRCREAEEK